MTETLISLLSWAVIAMIWATVIVGGWSTWRQWRARPRRTALRATTARTYRFHSV